MCIRDSFKIGKHEFYYSPNSINHDVESRQNTDDKSDLNAHIGKIFDVKRINVVKKFENPPRPFNQMTLVQKMESEKIGTKSTRANIIHTIINRDYIKDSQLRPTPLAKALVEILHNYSSGILSSEMTREIEEQLSGIEEKKITQEQVLEKTKKQNDYRSLNTDEKVAKVSAIGMGMRSQAGVAKKMFKALGEKGINIQAISTSEIKISVLIHEDFAELAVRSLHSIYGLDK